MVPYPNPEAKENVEIIIVFHLFGECEIIASDRDMEALRQEFKKAFIVGERLHRKIQAERRLLHFFPIKSFRLAPHIKPPLFSRRLEGGRAQRHRQKWKLKRQKAGLT